MSSNLKVNSLVPATGTSIGIGTTGGSLDFRSAATFGGNVTIGGTLTYDEVINIDSIGIVTARSGLKVTGGQLDVGNNIKLGNAGVITATSFSGSGANLTGITGTTINNNANNRIITGSGTANTLEGEANLTFDGDKVVVTQSAANIGFEVHSTGSGKGAQTMYHNDHGTTYVGVAGNTSGETHFYNASNTATRFYTNSAERLHIASSGQILIGETATSGMSANDLGMKNNAAIRFRKADGSAWINTVGLDNSNNLKLGWGGSVDEIHFGISGIGEQARFDSGGRLLIGATAKRNINNQNNNSAGDTTTPLLYAEGTGDSKSLTIVSNNTNAWRGSVLGLARTRGTSVGDSTVIQDDDNIGQIVFAAGDGTDLLSNCALIAADIDGTPGGNDTPGRLEFYTTADGAVTATERLRIDSLGRVLVGTTAHWGSDVKLHLANSGNTYLVLTSGTSNNGVLAFSDDGSERGAIDYDHNGDHMLFKTAAGERLRITGNGNIGLNGMAPGSSDETIAIQEPSGGSVAAVTLSHLSGGNRYGCKFETVSGANQGVIISSRYNSSYTERFSISGTTTTVREDTNKNIRFTGGIGEIGNVTGFQATNDANSALTDFGIRATTIRLATQGAERFRIGPTGEIGVSGAGSISYGNAGQVLRSGGNSAGVKWVEQGVGISHQWRLTSSVQGNQMPLTGWELVDTYGGGGFGTAMSESSGIFTFPSTGWWMVVFHLQCYSDNHTQNNIAQIMVTTNNSSYQHTALSQQGIYDFNNSYPSHGSCTAQALVDVTNTTNVKCRFDYGAGQGGEYAKGSSTYSYTNVIFTRLGDT